MRLETDKNTQNFRAKLNFPLSRVDCDFDGRAAATARRQCLVYRTHSDIANCMNGNCYNLDAVCSQSLFLFTVFDARHSCGT